MKERSKHGMKHPAFYGTSVRKIDPTRFPTAATTTVLVPRRFCRVALILVASLLMVGPLTSARAVPYSTNILVNGNAEAGPNSPTGAPVSVPGWTPSSAFTVVPYGAMGGFPQPGDPGPPNRGIQFFAGGNAASSTATQDIDLSANAADINAGIVRYNLSGWLGGYLTDGDNAQVTITFFDNANNVLGTAAIGPITPANRNNATGLFYTQSKGPMPVNTSRIHVVLTMTRTNGTFDDGYADNLSLILSLPSAILVTNLNDSGPGSLRAAIAAALPSETINFATNVTGTITLTSGELLVADSMTINGPGATVLTLSGNNAGHVFRFSSFNNVTNVISGLTITRGNANGSGLAGYGGGIYQDNGTILTLMNCTISSNTASLGGGGLYEAYGYVTLSNCLITHNSTPTSSQGGGILHQSGTLVLVGSTVCSNTAFFGGGVALGGYDRFVNSTIASNSAAVGGGLYGIGSIVAITNCTIARNSSTSSSGSGIYFTSGTFTIGNSIVAGNTGVSGESDCFGSFASLGFNFIGATNGSSGWNGPGDLFATGSNPLDPGLTQLQDNGGPTPTMDPSFYSPVIDQGKSFGVSTDQRGMPRPHDDPSIPNAAGGDSSDIGACEAGVRSFVVTNINDSGPGSLRQALLTADNTADFSTITFAPNVVGTINLISGELPIDASLNLIGPGARLLTINGNFASSILDLGYGTVTVSGLTLSAGGGISTIDNSADLTLINCTITGGSSIGVLSDGDDLQLLNCSILQNNDAGLAIMPGGKATVTSCTFISNAGKTYGGGIYNQGTVTLRGSTVAYNSASLAGGGIYNSGTLDIGDTIVALDSAPNNAPFGQDVSGNFLSSGYNLIGQSDGSAGLVNGVNQDLVGSSGSPLNPKFAFTYDNSGPTPVLGLSSGSPAIDQGNAFGITADQRGKMRPFDDPAVPNAGGGDGSDIGSVEVGAPPLCAECSTQIVVDITRTLRTANARWFGVNAAIWDSAFDTPDTLSALSEMGCRVLRYPGGSLSDQYHWATDLSPDGTYHWPTWYTNFAHVATNLGAQVFITVNYGTGTTNEAADWVRAANVTNHFSFKYWEIGNECYFDNEVDSNTAAPYQPHDPWTYAMRFKDYYTAMKAADPTIKIGMVGAPGEDALVENFTHAAVNPRTGQTHYGWTPVVLATLNSLGVTPDFLVHHFYPEQGLDDDADLLQAGYNWAGDAADLRQQLNDYLGPNATKVELVCTENNSDGGPVGRQSTSVVNALYLADSLSQLMKTEFNSYLWWDLRNGTDTPSAGGDFDPSLYGWRNYGDFGLINSGNRHPTFYALKLLQYFAQAGDTVLDAPNADPLLSTYAVRRASGTVTLLAINKDPANTITHPITLAGFVPSGTTTIRSYGIPQDEAARTNAPLAAQDIVTGTFGGAAPSFSYSFPPYSLTLFTFAPPGAPLLKIFLTMTNTAVISWPDNGAYSLQTNDNLSTTNWGNYAGTVTTVNGTNQITTTTAPGDRFFRLSQP
jgi:alpha-L-arabinofuranosidase